MVLLSSPAGRLTVAVAVQCPSPLMGSVRLTVAGVWAVGAGRCPRLRQSGSADLVLDVGDTRRVDGPGLLERDGAALEPLE